MNHLEEEGYTYFSHLKRAWGIAFVLLVHGLFPNIWTSKAKCMILGGKDEEDAS